MCTLAVLFRIADRYPLAIAANRDEYLARATAGPTVWEGDSWMFAGRDLVAGGTWLGINGHGMVAGILNRRTESAPDPSRRSRGELCGDCLRQPSLESAARVVCGHAGNAHNPFHLLLATAEEAMVLGNAAPAIARRDLAPGVHVLTNLDLDDPRCPRRAKAHALFETAAEPLRGGDLGGFLESAAVALADHSAPLDATPGGIPNNLCVHGDSYGTRSSTVIVFDAESKRFRYWHADGAPCRREHREYDLPYEA